LATAGSARNAEYSCASEQVHRFNAEGAEKTGKKEAQAAAGDVGQEWLCHKGMGLWFADFGAGLRQLFQRGLQGGAVFYIEDADGAVDLAEETG
jgi:hypothetical protein